MNFASEFKNFFHAACVPAQVYFVIVFINSIISLFESKLSFMAITPGFIIQLLIIFLVTYLTNLLCKNNLTFIAWIIAILPAIVLLSTLARVLKIKM